jgi:hypothetical protein
MQNRETGRWISELAGAILIGLAGFVLVYFIESDVLSGQVVIAIAFCMNIAVILFHSSYQTKVRVRRLSASFLIGALVATVSV